MREIHGIADAERIKMVGGDLAAKAPSPAKP